MRFGLFVVGYDSKLSSTDGKSSMSLDPKIKEVIELNMNTALYVYQDIQAAKDSLKTFTDRHGKVENPYDFLHGYILGDLQGSASSTARTMLGRPLRDYEITELTNLIQSKNLQVRDLLERVKRA